MQPLTVVFIIIIGYANCVLRKPQYVKFDPDYKEKYTTALIEKLRDHLHDKVDSVLWRPKLKDWIDEGLLYIYKPISTINIIVNQVGRIIKKTAFIQELKKRILTGVGYFIEFSGLFVGFALGSAKYKISMYFQPSQTIETTPMDVDYEAQTEDSYDYATGF